MYFACYFRVVTLTQFLGVLRQDMLLCFEVVLHLKSVEYVLLTEGCSEKSTIQGKKSIQGHI